MPLPSNLLGKISTFNTSTEAGYLWRYREEWVSSMKTTTNSARPCHLSIYSDDSTTTANRLNEFKNENLGPASPSAARQRSSLTKKTLHSVRELYASNLFSQPPSSSTLEEMTSYSKRHSPALELYLKQRPPALPLRRTRFSPPTHRTNILCYSFPAAKLLHHNPSFHLFGNNLIQYRQTI